VRAGTPAPLLAALDAALSDAMASGELAAGIARIGLIPKHLGAAAAAARIRREYAEWQPIVAASGFTPND
jgi:tripartite-type tricarboxylate transporter receptor subunit TctC